MKTEGFTNNEQNSLQAKELQKFFDKVKAVLLIPKESNAEEREFAMLALVLDSGTYFNFKDYGINKIIVDLLDNKYPILSIKVDDNTNLVGLSITDKNSGLTFILPDQPMGEVLLKFLKSTEHHDKIAVMLGFFEGDHLVFDKNIKSNFLIVLDGYIFE